MFLNSDWISGSTIPTGSAQTPNTAPAAGQQAQQGGNGFQNLFQNILQAAVGSFFGQANAGQQPIPQQPNQQHSTNSGTVFLLDVQRNR
jgi:hypothetical protein